MNSFEVHLSEDAGKFLEKLDLHIKERIETRLRRLVEEPVPKDAKFIKRDDENNKVFRYRIGDHRALYMVDERQQKVLITKIDKRPRIYERM